MASLIDALKGQLAEALRQNEKLKDDYGQEHERLKKYYATFLDSEKEVMKEREKDMHAKISTLEKSVNKFRSLYNKSSQKQGEVGQANKQKSYVPVTGINEAPSTLLNNYFYNANDIKANDRLLSWSKLERESDDLKKEFKRSFVEKVDQVKIISPTQYDTVYKDYYNKYATEKTNQINNDIMHREFERQLIINQQSIQPELLANPILVNRVEDNKKPLRLQPEYRQDTNNNIRTEESIPKQPYKEEERQVIKNQPVVDIINSEDLIEKPTVPIRDEVQFIQLEYQEAPQIQEKVKIESPKIELINEKIIEPPKEIPINKPTEIKVIKPSINKVVPDPIIEKQLDMVKFNPIVATQNVLPSPIIVSNDYPTDRKNNTNDYDYNDNFSVGNITSSNEWESDTNRKKHSFRATEVKEIKNTPVIITATKLNEPAIYKPEPTKIMEQTEKIDNKDNKTNRTIGINSIKEDSDESQNISNLIENVMQKKEKPNLEEPEVKRNSFNKYSTVNYESNREQEEPIEDLNSEPESEKYEDFIEDNDLLASKGRGQIDIDAIRYGSMNFGTSTKNVNNSAVNKSSVNKSQSIDNRIDKFLQSRNSNIEENIIEGKDEILI